MYKSHLLDSSSWPFSVQAHVHNMNTFHVQSVQVQMSSDHTSPCPSSGGWEGEQEDAGGVEVHVGGVVNQWPDIRDEELLRRFLLHILKLQVREFLKVIKTCQFNIVHWYCITVDKTEQFCTYFSFDWVSACECS